MGRDCASERGQRLEHGRLRGAPRRRKGCWKNVHRRRPARLLIAGRDDVNGRDGAARRGSAVILAGCAAFLVLDIATNVARADRACARLVPA
jgi:hypothetical protein